MKNKTKNTVKKLSIKLTIILVILICSQYILTGVYVGKEIIGGISNRKMLSSVSANTDTDNNDIVKSSEDPNEGQYLRLTDLNWRSESKAGWGKIRKNESDDNHTKLSIKREGAFYTFDYGIFAHANSNVYYDISEYSEKYHYLTMYVGLNKTATSGDGVKFWVYTSNNDTFYTSGSENWTTQNLVGEEKEVDILPNQDAVFVKVDIRGAKYLRLQAYQKSGNGSDHAVYIDPMFITDEYKEKESMFPDISVYDQKIKDYGNKKLSDPKYKLLVLQREFINRVGNYALERFIEEDPSNQAIIDWLMNDINNLEPYIMGGKPEGGSYFNSLKVLSRLYKERGTDLRDKTEITTTRGKSTLGEMYKTMMLAISLTHSGNVYLWVNGASKSDPVNRYDIYKKLYHGKVVADERTTKGIGDDLIEKNKFASLHVEEMRWLMNTVIDDEEIEWLNWFAREVKNSATGPYSYIRYTFGYNYNKDQYYDQANYDKWDQKYNLSKYNITYKKGNPKLWIVFEEGSVCGGLSKTGSCVWGSLKGLPSTCVSQPGHCAYIYYNQDANGNGVWGLGNDVGGWHQAGRTEHLNVRMPLEWGNQAYIDFNKDWLGMATYVLLAQGALNQYDNFVKSQEILMLADVYKDDINALYKIYNEALKILPINIDAWYGLIKAYRTDNTKKDADYYKLAEGIFRDLKLYPLPMYHIAREVQKNLTKPEYQFKFVIDQKNALTYAKDHSNESIQAQAVKQEAQHLLGQVDSSLANFSFDGENAGKIVLSSRFDGSDVAWDYSLDGKQTWTQSRAYAAGVHSEKLTKAQLDSITSENDIYVHIIGVDYSEENIYKIDITEQNLLSNLYANDWENRIIGVNLSTEWRYKETDAWTSYSKESPDLTGNKKVQIRQAATGTKLASPVSEFYTFTEDNQPDTRKYITISHLSVEGYSTQSADSGRPFYAPNAIDGNINTIWHTDFRQNVLQQSTKPFYTIKLDGPRYISALEFTQRKYRDADPAYIKNMRVYVSEDGKEWKTAGTIENCAQNYDLKTINFKESIYGQYVKLEMDTYDMFSSLALVNLYEDTTKLEKVIPTAGIAYSTTEKTNEPVVARLINPSTKIKITNNNGNDSYVFTENGKFTFEFEDERGNKGTATAIVNWIDKSGPTADVDYKLDENRKLIAILDNISEDSYLLDKSNKKTNYIEVENGRAVRISFLDDKGNTYKITEIDENRVSTKITYTNTTGKVNRVKYYVNIPKDGDEEHYDEQYLDEDGKPITDLTDEEKASLRVLQQITRSNPLEYYLERNEEHEFKLLDKANNITYKNVKVDYIDNDTKILVSDITYSTTTLTKDSVIATIKTRVITENGEGCAKVVNNNGSETYTFVKNDQFTFEYAECGEGENTSDEIKTHTAKVSWIDKDKPTAQIKYTTSEDGNKVVATLANESEEITIINNGGKRDYTFTKNDKFEFKFQDKAGNETTLVAKVDWIGKEQLKGDINYNGEVDLDDLAKIKLHFLEIEELEGDELKRADMDGDGEITVADIADIKLIILNSDN